VSEAPRFVWDLPAGQFRDRLQPVLEMRELIPLTRTDSKIHILRVLNKEDKTVLRLAIEENTVRELQGKTRYPLDSRVVLLPVKGYRKALKQAVKALEDLGLVPAQDDLMLTALAKTGCTPGSYSSKLDLHLDPAMRADAATRQILHRLLDIMIENEAGTRVGDDSEFLHDFRVAIRRTRSALTQIKGVIPARSLNRFTAEFAWLGQLTTPSRDLDVYLLNFDEYRASLPESAQNDLRPLWDFLRRHQRQEHEALVKGLDSARYRKLVQDWRAFLEAPLPKRSTLPNATRPVYEVACKRIWRVYQRALAEGRAIAPETPAEALHELRKTCKKLRYLIEFFQSLYPAADIKKLIKVLKTLQDNLGIFQDLEVQGGTLKQFSHQMMAEGEVPPETLMAMGMLVENLERRQHQAREAFAARFADFALPENRKQFRQLFAARHPEQQ
jgi:CHAD domain-containing protein